MQLALESAARTTYNAQEVAEHLGVAERTVRRWIAAGTLPARKVGRSFEIRVEDLERVLGSPTRKRVAVRAEERERELEIARLAAQLDLLQGMYERTLGELADVREELARERYRAELGREQEARAA